MHYFMGFQELPKYRIKVAHSRVLEEPLPELKAPEELQVVEFATHTEPATFTSLVGKAVNLRQLYFGYGSLSNSSLSDLEFDLPNLKLLHIADRTIVSKKAISTLGNNIVGFLQRKFSSIKALHLTTLASRPQTMEYVRALFKFIETHHGSLRKIHLNVNTALQRHLMREDTTCQVSDIAELSSPEDVFDLDKLTSVKLEEMDVTFGNKFFVGLEQWTKLLDNQKELVHLTFGVDKPLPTSLYVAPITQSASTLKSLHLGIEVFDEGTNDRSPVDCSYFESCCNLEMLVLVGPLRADLRPTYPELLNVDKLPKGLFGLAVENIFVETSQLSDLTRSILQRATKLERISLRNIGIRDDFGVTLAMLDIWTTTQVLQEIIVKGLNGDECQIHQFEQLVRFGVTPPLPQCEFHVIYEPNLMEYRRSTESAWKQFYGELNAINILILY